MNIARVSLFACLLLVPLIASGSSETGRSVFPSNAPYHIVASDTNSGGVLKLQHASIGNTTMNSGTIEVTSDKGSSEALSLTLGPSASFAVDLYAPEGTQPIDYLIVHGNISLGGSTLVVNPGTMFPGQNHTIIRNDGPNPIDGTFQGLPEGSWFIQSRILYRITYHGGSSGRDVVLLLPINTSTWLRGPDGPASSGAPVILVAHVISWFGAPTGSVEFFDGAKSIGTAPLDGLQDATLTTNALEPGPHVLTAVYPGSGLFGPNTSNALTQEISQGDAVQTQTEMSVSANPAMAGAPVMLRARVLAASRPAHGVVNFMDGSTVIGTADVASDQTASLSLVTLTPGLHTLTALYAGGGGFIPSTSAPVKQQIKAMSAGCVPVIVAPPMDTSFSANGTATLTVGTDGGQPQTFQWYAGVYPDASRPLTSAASAATITGTSSTDVWVVVMNGCGTAHASAHVAAYVPLRRHAAR